METIWFAIVAFMISVYIILDGFDLDTGIMRFLVRRNEAERSVTIRAGGPVWN